MEYTIGVLNKEHYKAIIDRLDELGYDTHSLGSKPFSVGHIGIEGENVYWSRYAMGHLEHIDLEDLYTDKMKLTKEREVKVFDGEKQVNVTVDERVVATIMRSERYNEENGNLIFLWDCVGTWKDKEGNKVSGHLTFELDE